MHHVYLSRASGEPRGVTLTKRRIMKSFQLVTAIHKETSLGLALLIAGLLFLLGTSPDKLPLLLLLVPYVITFLAILVLGRISFRITGFYDQLSSYKRNIILGTMAALPVLLLLLQSLRQLTIRDVLLVIALGVGLAFYLLRADFMD